MAETHCCVLPKLSIYRDNTGAREGDQYRCSVCCKRWGCVNSDYSASHPMLIWRQFRQRGAVSEQRALEMKEEP